MRIWLKPDERRPSPAPVQTDDRAAFLTGSALWLVALVTIALFAAPLTAAGNGWWLWAAVAGVALGIVGLLYTHVRGRRRS